MTKEEELMREILGENKCESLHGALPCGYSEGMGRNDEVDALLHIPVVDHFSMSMDVDDPREDHPTYPKPWPGQEKNVFRWYELENGDAVGWIISDPWKFIVYRNVA